MALYDFLYKDMSRLSSYYAQIFRGKLLSVEQTQGFETQKSSSGSGSVGHPSIALAKGDMQASDKVSEQSKNISDPHDMIVTDVLAYLRSENKFIENVLEAKHGELVKVSGSLSFIDRHMVQLISTSFDLAYISGESISAILGLQTNSSKKDPQQEKKALELFKKLFSQIPLQSAFNLETDEDCSISGTLKEECLEEPISSFILKHGGSELANFWIIGIKESSNDDTRKRPPIFEAGKKMSQLITGLIFPPQSIKITPLVIYREL
jgi:hypothetical protein